jgi:long-chain acyl-CoA synthetase
MHPSIFAASHPDRLAYVVVPNGEQVTYAQLEARSNQAAHLLRSLGLKRGDVIAILLENNSRYYELAWAADRSGLYYVCISTRLAVDEAAFILRDSGAQALFTSHAMSDMARAMLATAGAVEAFGVTGHLEGFRDYVAERDRRPTGPIADQSCGSSMLYSSGTTGRPKGVESALPEGPIDGFDRLTALAQSDFGFEPEMVYLSPAPLYHSAPLRWSMCVHKVGGCVVVMEKFEAELGLRLIQDFKVTVSQWVPTHFVRMLKLPAQVRDRYDLSSQKLSYHGAAPCPVPVKEEMLGWWGPIIREFYAGTEFNGMTAISAGDWLSHKGSVGQAIFGRLHICDDDGDPLPPRAEGVIYFEGGQAIHYHNDPTKTASAYNRHGWSTLGDIGWMDEDGFLYLTDRKSFMVISGGVNIYPREIEDALVVHPQVADVAVIGAPCEDLGERLVAIVQPTDWREVGPELARDLMALAERQLGRVKTPRQVDFMAELPRHPTGKLYKRLLRDEYRDAAAAGAQRPASVTPAE